MFNVKLIIIKYQLNQPLRCWIQNVKCETALFEANLTFKFNNIAHHKWHYQDPFGIVNVENPY